MELWTLKKALIRREHQLSRAEKSFKSCSTPSDSKEYRDLKAEVEQISSQYQDEIRRYETLISKRRSEMSDTVPSEDERSVVDEVILRNDGMFVIWMLSMDFRIVSQASWVCSVHWTEDENRQNGTMDEVDTSDEDDVVELIPSNHSADHSSELKDYSAFVEVMKEIEKSKGMTWTPQHFAKYAQEQELAQNQVFKFDEHEVSGIQEQIASRMKTMTKAVIKEGILEDAERMKCLQGDDIDLDVIVRSFMKSNEIGEMIQTVLKNASAEVIDEFSNSDFIRDIFVEILRESMAKSAKRRIVHDTPPEKEKKKPRKSDTNEVVARRFEYGDYIVVKMKSGLREYIITKGKKGTTREPNEITMHDAKEFAKCKQVVRHLKD